MLASILAALKIIGAIPAAASAIEKIGLSFAELIAASETEVSSDSPLGRIISGERKKLDKLIDEYYSIDDDGRYDEVEKNKYRKRISAQACSLLRGSSPISDTIPEYEKLIELFCKSFPSALA